MSKLGGQGRDKTLPRHRDLIKAGNCTAIDKEACTGCSMHASKDTPRLKDMHSLETAMTSESYMRLMHQRMKCSFGVLQC